MWSDSKIIFKNTDTQNLWLIKENAFVLRGYTPEYLREKVPVPTTYSQRVQQKENNNKMHKYIHINRYMYIHINIYVHIYGESAHNQKQVWQNVKNW